LSEDRDLRRFLATALLVLVTTALLITLLALLVP
jgi:hypothetical protein